MKIYIASDHAGFKLKEAVRFYLEKGGYVFFDLGVYSGEKSDWPVSGAKGAVEVSKDPKNSKAVIICGTGIGMSMVANKFKNVRAALCTDEYMAEMSRRHNNSNVLNLGARVISEKKALKILDVWLKTEFEGGRHKKRLDLLQDIEENNFK